MRFFIVENVRIFSTKLDDVFIKGQKLIANVHRFERKGVGGTNSRVNKKNQALVGDFFRP